MANPGMWQSPNRLYLNRDRTKVVPAGSPEQAHVLVAAGGEIPVAEAERYGLVKVREAQVTAVAPEPVEGQASETQSEGGAAETQTEAETEAEAETETEAKDQSREEAASEQERKPEPKAPTSGKR
jgi:hypothetical protein